MGKQKVSIWAIAIAVIFAIIFIGVMISPKENSNETKENKQDEKIKYLTSLEWTNSGKDNSDEVEEWLKVSIENDNYDGDILQAGTYTIKQTDGEYDGIPQRIYNLYVTDLNTENPDDVQNDSLPITVGGINGSTNEIELEKNQYLYIQKISGGEIGHLKLELK